MTYPPSTETLLALALLAGAPTWADAAAVLENHPELDDLDDDYLVAVGTAMRDNGREELGVSMIEAAFFLRITRAEGVARAVEEFANLQSYVSNLKKMPIWVNRELSNTIFGGKQTYSFWQQIFETGRSPQGVQVLPEPINLIRMIESPPPAPVPAG